MNGGRKPDFIFIGPAKTASTWMFKVLKAHPGVFVPPAKDLQFFDVAFGRGLEWYLGNFKNAGERTCGELSHDYILPDKGAIPRIKVALPDVRLLCCLRDPFERALSGAAFLRRNGWVPSDMSVREIAGQHMEIVEGGRYHTNLTYVFKHFPREQVLVLSFDDLRADSTAFAREIFEWIGVPFMALPVLSEVVNPRMEARNRRLAKVAKMAAVELRRLGLAGMVGKIKASKWVNSALFRAPRRSVGLKTEEVEFLRPYFNCELERLQADFGFSCEHWLR